MILVLMTLHCMNILIYIFGHRLRLNALHFNFSSKVFGMFILLPCNIALYFSCLLIIYFQATSYKFFTLLCLSQVFSMYTLALNFTQVSTDIFILKEEWSLRDCLSMCVWYPAYLTAFWFFLSLRSTVYSCLLSHAHHHKTPLHAEGKMSLLLVLICERERCVGNKVSVHGLVKVLWNSGRTERHWFLQTVLQNCTCTEGELPYKPPEFIDTKAWTLLLLSTSKVLYKHYSKILLNWISVWTFLYNSHRRVDRTRPEV